MIANKYFAYIDGVCFVYVDESEEREREAR